MSESPLSSDHDFPKLWGSLAALDVGVNATAIALPLLAYDVAGARWVGPVTAAVSVGGFVTLLGAGAVIDRLRRRSVMLGSLLVRILALAAGIVLLALHALSLVSLFPIAVLLGVSSSAFRPTEVAAVRRIVPEKRWPAAFARNQARSSIGDLAGSAVGGVLYAVGAVVPFALDALLAVGAVVGVRSIRADLGGGATAGRRPWHDARDGYRFVLRSRVLRGLILAVTVLNLVSYWPAFIVLMRSRGVGSGAIGLIGAGVGLTGILAAFASERILDALPMRAVLIGTVVVLAAGLIVMGLVGATPVVVVAVLAVSGFSVPFAITCGVIESRVTPDAYVGRVAATGRLLSMAAIPIGQVAGTTLLAAAGATVTFLVFAAPLVAVAVALSLARRFWQDIPAPGAPGDEPPTPPMPPAPPGSPGSPEH